MMHQLLFILGDSLTAAQLTGLLVDVVIVNVLILVSKRVFSPQNEARFMEESLIPLEDDTEEEKLRRQRPAEPSPRGRLDA
jgi:cbb3-type cytochrome oxidase subunit 3